MHIRCKFRVDSITRALMHVYDPTTKLSGQQEVRTIKMSVSYDPAFHGATPSGGIELSLVKEEHARHFKLGAEYYADFSPVEATAAEVPAPATDSFKAERPSIAELESMLDGGADGKIRLNPDGTVTINE